MKGTLLTYSADGQIAERGLTEPPSAADLQSIVGGWIELVPSFNTCRVGNDVRHCRVFCNEDGKRENLPVNVVATAARYDAMKRQGLMNSSFDDFLVGAVAIVIGDRELMEGL